MVEVEVNWIFNSTEYITGATFLCQELYIILSCGEGTILVLDSKNGHLIAKETNCHSEILALTSLFKTYFASSGDDGIIKIWNLDEKNKKLEEKARFSLVDGRTKWIENLLFVESENLLFASCGKKLKAWKVQIENQEFESISPVQQQFPDAASTITDLVYSKSKHLVAYCFYCKLVLLELPSLTLKNEFEWKASFIKLYWSDNGQYLLAAMQEASLVIWNLNTVEIPRYLSGLPGKVNSLSWKNNSQQFVMIAGRDSTCALFNIASIKPSSNIKVKFFGHEEEEHSLVKFCPSYPNLIATGARDGFLSIFDVTLSNENALMNEIEPPSFADDQSDAICVVEWFSNGLLSCFCNGRVECYKLLV